MSADKRPAAQPMDPERLRKLRRLISPTSIEAELLADRDHWEAKAHAFRKLDEMAKGAA